MNEVNIPDGCIAVNKKITVEDIARVFNGKIGVSKSGKTFHQIGFLPCKIEPIYIIKRKGKKEDEE